MGKKFFKRFSDAAAKVENSATERSVEAAIEGEGAAPLGEFDPLAGLEDDLALQEQIVASDEGAEKFVKPTVDMDAIEMEGDASPLKMLADQCGLRLINLGAYSQPSAEVIALLSSEQAVQLGAVPVAEEEDGLLIVAISDPSDPQVTDALHSILDPREVEIVVAASKEIKERIQNYYGMGEDSLEDVVAQVEDLQAVKSVDDNTVEIDMSDPEAVANQAPVIKLVNMLLVKAIKERASDIHIEPYPNLIRIRYRVDGILREIPSPPRSMLDGLTTRIKVLSRIDIAESRLPQDGRIKLSIDGSEVDLRVSTAPTVHGQALVMRVLDKSMMNIGISQIGMNDDILDRFLTQVKKPNGIVLVTGPTGSGKTTTLYAAVNEVNDPGDKMITVEDPVEFELPSLVQVNINESVGLTFGKCLRAILRQDPDTVLVGEIRDLDTAQISIQAALTGHLVFSTLHTNSAAATIIRLIDMGIKPFLITSALEAVVAQRLVRTICASCRAPYNPIDDDLRDFGVTQEDIKGHTFYHGEGCNDCNFTGYRGRLGLFELLEIDDEMRELIIDQATTDDILELAVRGGMQTIRQDGWEKITMGLTTFEEVARETPADVVAEPEFVPDDDEDEEGAAEEKPTKAVAKEPAKPALEAPQKQQPRLDGDTMEVSGEEAAPVGKKP